MSKKPKGRRASGGFSMVLHTMQKSAAWRELSGVAVKLLLHMIMLSKGNNGWGHNGEQGKLFLSEREAATAIGVSRNTASRAFTELIDHGFLRVVRAGHFHVKVRIATTWRLTFQPYPRAHQAPTNEWLNWRPEQDSRAQESNTTGAKIGHKAVQTRSTGAKIGAVESADGGKQPSGTGPITGPHLDIPGVGAPRERDDGCGWWTTDAQLRAVGLLKVAAMTAMTRQAIAA